MDFILGNTGPMGKKSLDYLWNKQATTMTNIANVDTPGYKAKYVTFEEAFRSRLNAVKNTSDYVQIKDAIKGARYQEVESRTESARLDGNNVNMDVENVELSRTTLQYQTMTNAISSDIMRYRTAIKGQ